MLRLWQLKSSFWVCCSGLLWLLAMFLVIMRAVLADYELPLAIGDTAKRIQVERGAGLSQVAYEMAEQGLIQSPRFLTIYGRLLGYAEELKAGEYEIEPGMSLKALLGKMKRGDVVIYQVTFVEGLGYREYLKALSKAESINITLQNLDGKQILALLNIPARACPEGLFFPDTYFYEKGESDLDILKRAHAHLESVLQKEWDHRAEGLPYVSPYEALIMASIVEKESASESEREQIAGVFVRRLQSGMRLQTDPTVIYGLGDDYSGNLTKQHLVTANPYNTYLNTGLPPTPIANPGKASIAAALHPAEGNSLYFVAKGDGTHQFSATLEEHEKAVEAYQKQRRADYRSSPSP